MKTVLLPHDKKKRIFVLDRNVAFREALSFLFKGKHELYGFSNVEEIQKAQIVTPDVIVVDILPTTRTHELAHIVAVIKKIYKKIPILIMSTNRIVFRRARRIGVKHHIEKPFDIDVFQQKISLLGN